MAKPLHEWTDEEIQEAQRSARAGRKAMEALERSERAASVSNAVFGREEKPLGADDMRRVLEVLEAKGLVDDAMRVRAAALIAEAESLRGQGLSQFLIAGESSTAMERSSQRRLRPDVSDAQSQKGVWSQVPTSAEQQVPLTTDEICDAFSGVGMSSLDWRIMLMKNRPGWLMKCQAAPGRRGGAHPVQATWDPLKIAVSLANGASRKAGTIPARQIDAVFRRPALAKFAASWQGLRADNLAWGD